GIQLGLPLAQIRFGLQTSNRDQTALLARLPVGPASSVIRRAKSQRQPNLGPAGKREIRRPLGAARKIKLRRKDANDRAFVSIDGNALAQQRRITAEAPLPKSMTDQRDWRSAGRFLVWSQCPAQQRCHAEGLEESGGHSGGTDAFRIAPVHKVGGPRSKDREFRETLALFPPRRNVGIGRRNLGHTQLKAGIVRPN